MSADRWRAESLVGEIPTPIRWHDPQAMIAAWAESWPWATSRSAARSRGAETADVGLQAAGARLGRTVCTEVLHRVRDQQSAQRENTSRRSGHDERLARAWCQGCNTCIHADHWDSPGKHSEQSAALTCVMQWLQCWGSRDTQRRADEHIQVAHQIRARTVWSFDEVDKGAGSGGMWKWPAHQARTRAGEKPGTEERGGCH